jgi:two-component system chemotaxis response regulator CheB
VTPPREPARHAVALIASAGGVTAIGDVLAALPVDLPAALIVLIHLLPEHTSHLAEILGRRTSLRVRQATEGDVLEVGSVYVAPPDAHLLVSADGILSLQTSPPVRHLRPSGDVLLESLAASYEDRCLAVVLSGTGSDGAVGTLAVKRAGGTVLVQDENSSAHFGMPRASIEAGTADRVAPLDDIAAAVLDFAATE